MIDNFHEFAVAIDKQFQQMAQNELFTVDIDKDTVWNMYLSAFPEGTNPIFRERTEHDCSCCRQFVKNIGALVSASNETVWDVSFPGFYGVVANRMAEFVKAQPRVSVFRTKETRFGRETTIELINDKAHTWNHFFNITPKKFLSATPDADIGVKNSFFQVLKRGLNELTLESLDTILDLIESNALYRGEEHKSAVQLFRKLKYDYSKISDSSYADDGKSARRERNNFVWNAIDSKAAGFRNTVIGTLAVDLSSGVELEHAVRSFEQKVAPSNYKRPSALITPNMIKNAVKVIQDLGLESAIKRRYAVLSDVSVNNVLFVDNTVRPVMKDSITQMLLPKVKTTKKAFDATNIDSNTFIEEIIPGATSVALHLDNTHLSSFVSLTAPVDSDIEPIFKWNNNFAWSYDGDVTDSIKERVKAAGGNTNALLRVSLSWFNYDDLDIHCTSPDGHIYFGNKMGILDVDMNAFSSRSRTPVENLAFTKLSLGSYKFCVNNYTKRENIDIGFEIECEYQGKITHLSYDKPILNHENVDVLTVDVKDSKVTITPTDKVLSTNRSVEKWGLNTNNVVPVDTMILSPNHWDDSLGNKHYFFILKGCKNPNETRGIYNEFLRNELHEHRKVFEVLGAQTKCPVSDNQLSGVGFSSTRKDKATFTVVKNNTTRTYNVQF